MWTHFTRRTSWRLSDNGVAPVYCAGGDRDLRVRALQSASQALQITEHPDHVLFEVVGGPGGGSPLDAWPVGSVYIAVDAVSPATRFGGGTWAPFGAGRVLVGLDAADVDFDTAEETGGSKSVTLTEQQMPSHTHVQDSHTHVQNAHNHTQDSHNHTQNSFAPRILNSGTAGTVGVQGASAASNANASNSATTATNQAATATNQAATAVNQSATAVNQSTGGGAAHANVQPYIVVFMWKRTA